MSTKPRDGQIDAKVGGFGMVPVELDGAIVSSHYFLFEINPEQLDYRFLEYYIRTTAFQSQISAQGSTNYAAIRPRDVLNYSMPLPPLGDQQRVIAELAHLDAAVDKSHALAEEANDLEQSILTGIFKRVIL